MRIAAISDAENNSGSMRIAAISDHNSGSMRIAAISDHNTGSMRIAAISDHKKSAEVLGKFFLNLLL